MSVLILILSLLSDGIKNGMIDNGKYYQSSEKIRCEELYIEPNEFVICDIVPKAKKYGIRNRYVWKYEEIDHKGKTIYCYHMKNKKDGKITIYFFTE